MPSPKDVNTGLTVETLKAHLSYRASNGKFFWHDLERPNQRGPKPKNPAGAIVRSAGHRKVIQIPEFKFKFLTARLAFLYMTGQWPKGQVDHADLDPTNDSWENLKDVSPSEARIRVGLRSDNREHVSGVHKSAKGWRAQCAKNGKIVYRKWFKTREEAVSARMKAVRKYHGEYEVEEMQASYLAPFLRVTRSAESQC